MRQVQAHEAPRRDLRQVRRGSHAVARSAANGSAISSWLRPARTCGSSRACPAASATSSTSLCATWSRCCTSRPTWSSKPAKRRSKSARSSRTKPSSANSTWQYRASGFKAMMGAEAIKELLKRVEVESMSSRAAREDAQRDFAAEAPEVRQAPQGGRGLPQERQQAAVDDPGRDPGDSAGAASAGSTRWRPLCDLRSERSVSPRHQPQQPVEEADGPARSRSHRAQRKAHVAGSRGRAVRQRTPWPRAAWRQQSPAQVAVATR